MRGDEVESIVWDDFSGDFRNHFFPQKLREG